MIEEPPALTVVRRTRRPTEAQIAAFRGVPTGFVCDAMEGGGAMAADISPLGGARSHAVGPALVAENGPADILATLAAVSLAEPGDVVVVSAAGHRGCSASGDQVCGMLRNAGAAALVTDGPVRDLDGIEATGLPVWAAGLIPSSPHGSGPGRVGGAAVVGGLTVATGDLIVADETGVVVVPFERIDAVIEGVAKVRALEEELEAKVADGFRSPLDVAAMIADGRAVEVD